MNPHNVKDIDVTNRLYFLNILTNRNDGIVTKVWGIKRPHCDEFLNFLHSTEYVIILDSIGTYDYVHAAESIVFKNTYRPDAILTRNDSVVINGSHQKPLAKIIKSVPGLEKYVEAELDDRGMVKGYKNMLIIDDRRSCFEQDPQNGILIPAYEPHPDVQSMKRDDIRLLQIMEWLKRPDVQNSTDVRTLDKSNIFNTVKVN